MLRSTCSTLRLWTCALLLAAATPTQELALVEDAEAQPLGTTLRRVVEALDYLGSPLPAATQRELDRILGLEDDAALVRGVQELLDPLCLLGIHINPEARVKVHPGPAPRQLVEGGWRSFLIKVHNQAGVTAPMRVLSKESGPLGGVSAEKLRDRWLALGLFGGRPLTPTLAGCVLEYRILNLYSRDAGKRSTVLTFDVGQGSQDLGFRSDSLLTFDCAPSTPVTLRVADHDGSPTTASFTIRDPQNRVHPARIKRLAPDFSFQSQIYRSDGETVGLPPGTYTFEVTRGPEYRVEQRTVSVGDEPMTADFKLERWVHPAARGWWPGDHHIHAAGCSHYREPTQGVTPETILRHCAGESLNVGCVLTWSECFSFQQQFFTGKVHEISKPDHLLRYDIEISGFASHRSGHLCLLGLKHQLYPGYDSLQNWPTLGLTILRWAQRQGAVCGTAHSGSGLDVATRELPNYEIPPFDGIGAMEYIVDITHKVRGPGNSRVPAVDFLGVCDTVPTAELNIWYHTLNCGFRPRISGESDFPCIFAERIGSGRSYVKLDGPLDFDAWRHGIAKGRCYVSDGRSHLLDFTVGGLPVGTKGSELRLGEAGSVRITADAAALLPVTPRPEISRFPLRKPYWHIEHARVGKSRTVPVEIVVNGQSVARKALVADGTMREVSFDIKLERSSWVAMRILPSSHTNPVFVIVDDRPIRASRKSATWCLQSVNQCWRQKRRFIRKSELTQAVRAYEHARKTYRRIRDECETN